MAPSRRNSNSSSKATPAARRRKTNPVEQLNLLRGFVGNEQFSETDLTECLRQCGYNVERAAERLITGTFQRSSGRKKKNGKSAFFSAAEPVRSKNNNGVQAAIPKKNGIVRRQSKIAPTSLTSSISSKAKSQKKASVKLSKVTTKTSNSVEDLTQDDDETETKTISNNSKAPPPQIYPERLLLCRRWISDAVITCRTGSSVKYNEELLLQHSKTGDPMVRFRGNSVEGRLPVNLAVLLTPLLRVESTQPLVQVQAESLMGETKLVMGATLPVQLSVYITSPKAFFDTMLDEDPKGGAGSTSKASQYFQDKAASKQKGRNTNKKLSVSEAAFHLLQWAEYGDVPHFPPPKDEEEDAKPSAESLEDKPASSSSDTDEVELNEDDFEAVSVEGKTAEGEALAESVENACDSWSANLAEADDPTGFTNNVTLRPYQKQALHFMMQREKSGESREQVEEQLQLLRELSAEQQKQQQKGSIAFRQNGNGKDISCDCGPVVVSEAAQKKSKTLDGEINPVNHPLWKRRFLASAADLSNTISFYVNELLGIATYRPPEPPKPCSGGILGDAMGLGKTVMLMALILKSKEERLAQQVLPCDDDDDDDDDEVQVLPSGNLPTTTLVVVKLSVLPQWEDELGSKTNLTYKIFYGQNGKPPSVKDLQSVDVVVTTYGTVQGELKRKNPVLSKCHYLRVILDEAHCIRNQRTLASKVCCNLIAEHRWCVSGTIIQNSLDDVFGIMKFLKHEPWCWPAFWKTAITAPANAKTGDDELDPALREELLNTALNRVRRLLGPIMLRRTKDSSTKDGKPILSLPPIETKVVKVELSETEREFYNAVLARSLEVFDGFVESGSASKAYFQILSLLQRLRQTCDHISLTVRSKIDDDDWNASGQDTNAGADTDKIKSPVVKDKTGDTDALGTQFLDGLLQKFCAKQQSPRKEKKRDATESQEGSPEKRPKDKAYVSTVAHTLSQAVEENSKHIDEECAICLENPKIDEAVLTPCAHIFCRDCLIKSLRRSAPADSKKISSVFQCPDGLCPTCQEKVEANRIIVMSKSRSSNGNSMTTSFLTDSKPPSSRTIKQEIRETKEGNPYAVARQILENAVSGSESSKMKAVIEELNSVWKVDPASKVLIFSQYLGFLDLLETQMRSHDIPFFRLDGSLKLKERMDVLNEFRLSSRQPSLDAESDSDTSIQKGTVLLMSMSAGGEGLNVVEASSCFIIDPWWNSAKEDQCINRIHRFGQNASIVRVRKFVVTDSVEERIVELQRRKAYVASEVYSDAGGKGDLGSARLSLDDFRLIFQCN